MLKEALSYLDEIEEEYRKQSLIKDIVRELATAAAEASGGEKEWLLEKALEIARKCENPSNRALILASAAKAAAEAGGRKEAMTLFGEAERLALTSSGQPPVDTLAYTAQYAAQAGLLEEAEKIAERAVQVALRTGTPSEKAYKLEYVIRILTEFTHSLPRAALVKACKELEKLLPELGEKDRLCALRDLAKAYALIGEEEALKRALEALPEPAVLINIAPRLGKERAREALTTALRSNKIRYFNLRDLALAAYRHGFEDILRETLDLALRKAEKAQGEEKGKLFYAAAFAAALLGETDKAIELLDHVVLHIRASTAKEMLEALAGAGDAEKTKRLVKALVEYADHLASKGRDEAYIATCLAGRCCATVSRYGLFKEALEFCRRAARCAPKIGNSAKLSDALVGDEEVVSLLSYVMHAARTPEELERAFDAVLEVAKITLPATWERATALEGITERLIELAREERFPREKLEHLALRLLEEALLTCGENLNFVLGKLATLLANLGYCATAYALVEYISKAITGEGAVSLFDYYLPEKPHIVLLNAEGIEEKHVLLARLAAKGDLTCALVSGDNYDRHVKALVPLEVEVEGKEATKLKPLHYKPVLTTGQKVTIKGKYLKKDPRPTPQHRLSRRPAALYAPLLSSGLNQSTQYAKHTSPTLRRRQLRAFPYPRGLVALLTLRLSSLSYRS